MMKTLGIVSINHSLCHYSFRGSKVVPFSTSRYGWRPPSPRCCLCHAHNVSWDGTPIVKPKQIDVQTDVQSSSTGVSTNIDWANLSHEEFDEQLQNLRQRLPNFSMTMLSEDEREKFWLRRNAAALKVAQEVSDMIGNNDLITPLEELRHSRGGDSLVEFTNVHSTDVKCSNFNIPDEKFSERDVEEAASMYCE